MWFLKVNFAAFFVNKSPNYISRLTKSKSQFSFKKSGILYKCSVWEVRWTRIPKLDSCDQSLIHFQSAVGMGTIDIPKSRQLSSQLLAHKIGKVNSQGIYFSQQLFQVNCQVNHLAKQMSKAIVKSIVWPRQFLNSIVKSVIW